MDPYEQRFILGEMKANRGFGLNTYNALNLNL